MIWRAAALIEPLRVVEEQIWKEKSKSDEQCC